MADPLFNMSNYDDLLASDHPEETLGQLTPESTRDPRVRALIEELSQTAEGRERLERHRENWSRRGIPAPWDRPTGGEPIDTDTSELPDAGDGDVKR